MIFSRISGLAISKMLIIVIMYYFFDFFLYKFIQINDKAKIDNSNLYGLNIAKPAHPIDK